MIFFDNAATTFIKPSEVYRVLYENMVKYGANAGRGGHRLSVRASEIINETREQLCDFFGIENMERLAFFQNATYALNVGIKGVLERGDHVVTTSMEHNAVMRPLAELKRNGVIEFTTVKANEKGEISLEDIQNAVRYKTKLIVMTHASNVCGNIYDIQPVYDFAKSKGILFMADCAQTAGVEDINSSMADMFAFSGHKGLFGSQGTGGLYIREGLSVKTLVEGGTGSNSESFYHPDIMPDKFECGTQNMPAISTIGAGLRFIKKIGIKEIREYEQYLADYFVREVKNISGVTVYGTDDYKKRTGTVSITVEGRDLNVFSTRLSDEFGIAVRSGFHCAPAAHRTLGTQDSGTIRFSFGYFNKKYEIDKALQALNLILKSF